MADDPQNRGPADRPRVNVNKKHEARYWAEKYNVTPESLKKAAQEMGPIAADVHKKPKD